MAQTINIKIINLYAKITKSRMFIKSKNKIFLVTIVFCPVYRAKKIEKINILTLF